MVRSLVAGFVLAAAAIGSAAPSASAIVPCQHGDVNCYRTCYLPHYDKPSGSIYWVNC